jgi:hypothetical protein
MSRVRNTRSVGTSWLFAGAGVVRIVVMSLYLWLSRWPKPLSSPGADYAAFAICLVVGALFVIYLPFRLWVRALIVAAYAPLAYAVLLLYSLLFVGLAFGNWL